MKLCLFGASSDHLASAYFEAVNLLGKEMGRRQIGLVFGGGATGLMGAACRGAAERRRNHRHRTSILSAGRNSLSKLQPNDIHRYHA